MDGSHAAGAGDGPGSGAPEEAATAAAAAGTGRGHLVRGCSGMGRAEAGQYGRPAEEARGRGNSGPGEACEGRSRTRAWGREDCERPDTVVGVRARPPTLLLRRRERSWGEDMVTGREQTCSKAPYQPQESVHWVGQRNRRRNREVENIKWDLKHGTWREGVSWVFSSIVWSLEVALWELGKAVLLQMTH